MVAAVTGWCVCVQVSGLFHPYSWERQCHRDRGVFLPRELITAPFPISPMVTFPRTDCLVADTIPCQCPTPPIVPNYPTAVKWPLLPACGYTADISCSRILYRLLQAYFHLFCFGCVNVGVCLKLWSPEMGSMRITQ